MDPFSAFFLACWFAYILVLDKVDPKGADRRHQERMQRQQHAHERWLERRRDRRSARENPRAWRRAFDERLAGWVAGAGRRQERVAERIRIDEERGGAPSSWRQALRNWRETVAAANRRMAERAEHRFSTREPELVVEEDQQEPEVEPGTQYWAGQRLDVDTKELEPAEDVEDSEMAEDRKLCHFCGSEHTAHIEDGKRVCHHCWLNKYYWKASGAATSRRSEGEPETKADATETPAPTGAEAPSNVIPINRGETRMSDVQTLTLGSGETIDPEIAISFADALIAIYREIGSRIQASIANLSGAVDPAQVAKLSEMLNLNSAAEGKAAEMKGHFTDHQNAQSVAGAAGLSTDVYRNAR